MEEAAFVCCECGYRVLCVVRRWGERLGTLTFFDCYYYYDDDEEEEVLGEAERRRLTHCPGCGVRLGNRVLVPKRRPD